MKKIKGFTLAELLIALVVAAILAAIGVPAYTQMIKKSYLRGAETDLANMSVVMNNYYQQQLAYPASASTTSDIQNELPSWKPTQSKYFNYQINSTNNGFTLTATGLSTELLSGYNLSLDNANIRTGTDSSGGVIQW